MISSRVMGRWGWRVVDSWSSMRRCRNRNRIFDLSTTTTTTTQPLFSFHEANRAAEAAADLLEKALAIAHPGVNVNLSDPVAPPVRSTQPGVTEPAVGGGEIELTA